MEELILYIAKNFVNNPNMLEVTSKTVGKKIIINIKAENDDLGKIIGRNGKIINSIRTIVNSLAKKGEKYIIKVANGE